MNNILALAMIGVVEATVYLFRYRSATARSAVVSAVTSFFICVTRVWFVFLGASAVIEGSSLLLATLAYGGSATITTGVLHEWLERRKAKREGLKNVLDPYAAIDQRKKQREKDTKLAP